MCIDSVLMQARWQRRPKTSADREQTQTSVSADCYPYLQLPSRGHQHRENIAPDFTRVMRVTKDLTRLMWLKDHQPCQWTDIALWVRPRARPPHSQRALKKLAIVAAGPYLRQRQRDHRRCAGPNIAHWPP